MPSPSASVLGQSVTFTAQVAPSRPAPGYADRFGDVLRTGRPCSGPYPLSAGTASISTSDLGLGSHSITAVYSGDGNDFLASTSSPSIELVGGTTVALVSSTNPSHVRPERHLHGDGRGRRRWQQRAHRIGHLHGRDNTPGHVPSLASTGVASISTTSLSGGTHAITAVYGGAPDFAASTSSQIDQVVNQATTTTTLSPSEGQSTFGQSVTLTATVIGAVGTPTGSVTFKDGSTVLATCRCQCVGYCDVLVQHSPGWCARPCRRLRWFRFLSSLPQVRSWHLRLARRRPRPTWRARPPRQRWASW